MHLLLAQPGEIVDGTTAVDLDQTPGAIVVLTAADSEIACLAAAQARRAREGGAAVPSLRIANPLRLMHNLSVDLYVDKVIAQARLVVARLLGGRGYWPYGVDEIVACCRARGIALALLPGDDKPDPELAALSTAPAAAVEQLWRYLNHGGIDNAARFLRQAAALIGGSEPDAPPVPLPRAGFHWPDHEAPSPAALRAQWRPDAAIAAIIFYRALAQSGDTGVVDALVAALTEAGLNPLPIFVASLKDADAAAFCRAAFGDAAPAVIVNLTGFALGGADAGDPLTAPDCPVLQAVLSSGGETAWREGMRGLSARDIAMSVALPEIDGRVLSRAISFKGLIRRDPLTQCDLIGHVAVEDRVRFVAALAASWGRLRLTPPAERRIAIVLANYPNRDGRLGNGVGLDTPAGVIEALRAMARAGYDVGDAPDDGAALMRALLAGPTNNTARLDQRAEGERLALIDYSAFFAALPLDVQAKVTARWGPPEADPFFRPGELDCGAFRIAALRFGRIVIAVQPARGYNIDPKSSYHDPDLVPPHGYLAFHAWVRQSFAAQAVIHFGKHGNLEWLPGKSLALSASCFPEAALGPLPHLYPFIVNDPGEGTQAKRRAGAVIVDHLTPPLTRAESYGPLRQLEQLVDEYYEAAGLDPRRLRVLERAIRDLAATTGLDRDCGIVPADTSELALRKLDGWLCEIKESQIRDGLHVFGRSPEGNQLADLLVALTRCPRPSRPGFDDPANASLLRALADDLGLGFDPLACDMAEPWSGPRPVTLVSPAPWRSHGDTVERLEELARALVSGTTTAMEGWTRTRAVLDRIERVLRPAVRECGAAEIDGLLRGLDGRRVAPGPSGAPTRGRPEVLPTGRNFYSVDIRGVPTPAAWQLGWRSAGLLLERHAQEHGAYPKAMALSAWGTSNMRTGGDDIAQALALLGVRPCWEPSTGRVTGFEIMPASVLDRPRIDVTLRISGFFRDAFPNLIDLFDSAARAVAALDEPEAVNPLAARARAEAARLVACGASEAEARRRAGARVFGAKPGAYGAGLQALIDEGGWTTAADLAGAYLAWGGFAYDAGGEGRADRDALETRLAAVEAVIHNQDNREHDLLDSDDYYQFEGGMAAAVAALSGRAPAVYHNDHSRPETPRIRTLVEEIARVVRARVVNPKWIAGCMRHGYKGAFEMAATVDYMFAFAATTGAVADHHFDAVLDAYVRDEAVRGFMAEANPAALAEMSQRLIEARERGLWRPRANDTMELLQACAARRQ